MRENSKFNNKIAIIGAGPAGIAAAIQLKRSGFTPIIFEKGQIGGLLNNAHRVENYPGFPCGISGPRLVSLMRQHLDSLKIKVRNQPVVSVTRRNKSFVLKTEKRCYYASILIVASGTKPRFPDGFSPLQGKRIFSEVYPIRHLKDKKIVIVGGGDAAFDYALNLARKNRVVILNRRDRFKCLPRLYQQIQANEQIQYRTGVRISTINQSNNYLIIKLTKVHYRKGEEMICDYVIYAIGREPALDFLSPPLRRSYPEGDNRYIHFIGDVKNGNLRQTAIAVGDGIKAAMKINEFLRQPVL